MTTAARTVLAVLALIAGTLSVASSPAAAAPPHSGECHSVSEGFKSWVGYQTTMVDCGVAHDLGKRWSGNCGRSSSTVHAMHCDLTVTVGSFPMTFSCANTKATQSPSHYHVHCHHAHSKVSFTFFPHGF